MSDDLIIWLRAQLDEDERGARAGLEAKRRILDRGAGFQDTRGLFGAEDVFAATAAQLRWVFRVLALPYADREGYREEWRL